METVEATTVERDPRLVLEDGSGNGNETPTLTTPGADPAENEEQSQVSDGGTDAKAPVDPAPGPTKT
jgi:hypothetical protein